MVGLTRLSKIDVGRGGFTVAAIVIFSKVEDDSGGGR
jgi:hypothetical protein